MNLSMEGQMLFVPYYRGFGVRRPVQFVAPTMHKLATLSLPRNSILHYVSDDESSYGIAADDPILQGETRLVSVDHVMQLAGELGPPRPTRLPAMKMAREYHAKYRRLKRMTSEEAALRDPASLVVVNYALLPQLYRYTQTYFASYYKWANIQTTVWKRIGDLTARTDRQQFLECKLPKHLPTLQQLARGSGALTRQTLSMFNEPSSLFVLELWKWLGDTREQSMLAGFTQKQLEHINLVWIESGQWFTFNLGLVNTWRKSEQFPQAAISPQQMQRRFLRLLMFLFEARTVADHTEITEIPGEFPTPVKIKIEGTEEMRGKTLTLKPGMDVENLPDAHVEETPENIALIDAAITKDLSALDERMEQMQVDQTEAAEAEVAAKEKILPSELSHEVTYTPATRTLESGVMDPANAMADRGLLSAAEYRRLQAISTAYQKLPDPYGRADSMVAASTVHYDDLKLRKDITVPDAKTIVDKSMLQSSLFDFDTRYITTVMPKDVVRTVLNVQHAGVAVTGYTVEEVEDALGHYENHTVQLTPVRGKSSTVHFRLPKVQEDGTFRSNGVRCRLRKQRGDMPIRKLSSSKVALTSYYSKTFVNRSEKQVHNFAGALTNRIAAKGMDPNDSEITNLLLANVFDSYVVVPRIYSVLASRFRSFKMGEYEFFLDHHARIAKYGEAAVTAAERNGLTVMGNVGKSGLIVVDATDTLYVTEGESVKELGKLENMLNITKLPMEMVEVKVLNKHLPIGLVLGYSLGLSQVLSIMNLRPRRVPSGERLNLADDEFALRFSDEALVFSRENKLAAMVLSGFNSYENSIRNYPVHLFDKKEIYLNLVEQNRLGARYLREVDMMNDLFVDPITRTILEQMREPTDFVGLLLRSCELLLSDWAPSETDMAYMRNRGYERVAGAVYAELVRSIRMHRSKGQMANSKIEMAPYAVWQLIQQDPAVKLVEESNPIHNLKEKEEITFSGVGGRSGRSMVKRTRVFHPNDMGVISEATKDSGDVAITTFLTADPNLVDLYGTTKRYDPKEDGPTSLLSTSALISPCADRDDPKRVNFISIQQSAGTFAKGYTASPLRTGYEQIVAHRTDDLFATTAKQSGVVTRVTPKSITVTYADGTTQSVELGRRFGTAAGSMFPHELKTALREGAKVDAGDCIAYNSHYFSLDPINPKQAIMKSGVLVKTAIMDTPDTLEDSSAISQRAAELLETRITKVRNIVVSFDQAIHNLVTVGEHVDVEDILCTIEDAVTAQNTLFDENSLDTLRLIAANTPKAKFRGTVEKIEVFYHGDIDDLSPGLQEVAVASDQRRRREAKELNRKFTSGRVDEGLRIDNNPLAFEHAVIRVYISGNIPAGVGDKGVFGNQLKTIFGRVMVGENKTVSGEDIDAIFGYESISARIVLSPELMGTTNTLLKVISKRVVDAYRGVK